MNPFRIAQETNRAAIKNFLRGEMVNTADSKIYYCTGGRDSMVDLQGSRSVATSDLPSPDEVSILHVSDYDPASAPAFYDTGQSKWISLIDFEEVA